MSISKEEIEEDIKELKLFQASVSRQRNIDLLGDELNRCEKILQCVSLLEEDSARFGTKEQQSVLHQQSGAQSAVTAPNKSLTLPLNEINNDNRYASHKTEKTVKQAGNNATTASDPVIRTETIRTYGWDQTPKLVKLYVRVAGVRKNDKVSCSFTGNTCTLSVSEVNNKNYSLVINNLARPIIARKSCHETRKDEVVVKLFKSQSNQDWPAVTAVEAAMMKKKLGNNIESKPVLPDTNKSASASRGAARGRDKSPKRVILGEKGTEDIHCEWEDLSGRDMPKSIIQKFGIEKSRWSATASKVEESGTRDLKVKRRLKPESRCVLAGDLAYVVHDDKMAENAIKLLFVDPPYRIFFRLDEILVPVQAGQVFSILLILMMQKNVDLSLRMLDRFWLRYQKVLESNENWINQLLASSKAETCRLLELFGNFSAAAIRKLPHGTRLGLALTCRAQYDAIQTIKQNECFELSIQRGLDVTGYTPLKPWPELVVFHFYGIRDCDPEWMTGVLRTLANGRDFTLVLPGSEITERGCHELIRCLKDVKVNGLWIDAPNVPESRKSDIKNVFQGVLRHQFDKRAPSVRWNVDFTYNWFDYYLDKSL